MSKIEIIQAAYTFFYLRPPTSVLTIENTTVAEINEVAILKLALIPTDTVQINLDTRIACFHRSPETVSMLFFPFRKADLLELNMDKYRLWPAMFVFVYLRNLITRVYLDVRLLSAPPLSVPLEAILAKNESL